MNNTLSNLNTRFSTKKFKPDMIPEEILNQIIEAGIHAPTGKNLQSPIILAITNKQVRDELSKLNAKILGVDIDPFYGAPVVLVVLADKKVPTYIYDGSLVMGNLMNAAHALGIGNCWIHRAKEEFELPEGKKILEKLGITGDYEGIGHCILGYSDMKPSPKPKKDNWVYHID